MVFDKRKLAARDSGWRYHYATVHAIIACMLTLAINIGDNKMHDVNALYDHTSLGL